MSDKMTLLPCPFCGPFCGGEAEMYSSCGMAIIECKKCHVHSKGYTSEAKAIAAWNTRADLGNGTCENVWAEFDKFKCSECATEVDSISTNTTCPKPILFCPNCGRKVKQWKTN